MKLAGKQIFFKKYLYNTSILWCLLGWSGGQWVGEPKRWRTGPNSNWDRNNYGVLQFWPWTWANENNEIMNNRCFHLVLSKNMLRFGDCIALHHYTNISVRLGFFARPPNSVSGYLNNIPEEYNLVGDQTVHRVVYMFRTNWMTRRQLHFI